MRREPRCAPISAHRAIASRWISAFRSACGRRLVVSECTGSNASALVSVTVGRDQVHCGVEVALDTGARSGLSPTTSSSTQPGPASRALGGPSADGVARCGS